MFKDKESFLDALFDHIFPEDEGEVDDEDERFFNEKVIPFFDQFEQSNEGNKPAAPRRKRQQQSTPRRKRRSGGSSNSSSYGSSMFFGANQ